MPDTITKPDSTNWPELAEGLFTFLTGRGATIEYDLSNMEIDVPSSTGPNAQSAKWRLNGKLSIRTSDQR